MTNLAKPRKLTVRRIKIERGGAGRRAFPIWNLTLYYREAVAAVEKIDELILAPVLKYLEDSGEDFRILVLPDHPTPVAIRTHSSDPVPFFLYDPAKITDGVSSYSEAECAKKDYFIPDGSTLLSHMIEK